MAEPLASSISRHHPGKFNRRQFLQNVFDADWEQRELKARLQHIRASLHQHMRLPYTDALPVLMAAAPEFGGYHAILFPDYVEAYGLDSWQLSMRALVHFTQYSSAEFAVRPFLVKDSELQFEFTLVSTPASVSKQQTTTLGRLRIEYGIDYVKANGQQTRKIFQISEGEFAEAARTFRKNHSLRQMTTRTHYVGEHGLALLINGREVARKFFYLGV